MSLFLRALGPVLLALGLAATTAGAVTGCAAASAIQPRLVGPDFYTDPRYGKCVALGAAAGPAEVTAHICGRITDGPAGSPAPDGSPGTDAAAGDP